MSSTTNLSNYINKDNAWYQLGKEYAKLCSTHDLDSFLKRNNLYTTLNFSSKSSFKKGTFEKLIKLLEEKGVNTSRLIELYPQYSESINGLNKYFFYWGYDVEKMHY